MFGRKKAPAPSNEPGRRKGSDLMNQMGFAMPGMDEGMMYGGGDDDDDDLEAEFAALAGDSYQPKAKPKRKAPVPMADIESMARAGMEDVDENVSDTEDPDLLEELQDLSDEEPPEAQGSPAKSVSISPEQFHISVPSQPSPVQKRQSPVPTSLGPSFPPASSTASHLPSSGHASPAARPVPSPSPSPQPSPAPKSNSGGTVGLLEDRLTMYKAASANAKTAGDSSKLRRLDRGIKTIAGLLRQAKAGKPINEDEIPPPVAMGASSVLGGSSRAPVISPASTESDSSPLSQPEEKSGTSNHSSTPGSSDATPSSDEGPGPSKISNNSTQMLTERRDQYRKAALIAKKSGDMAKAGSYVKVSKQFDIVIKAIEDGKEVDLSKMPPPPAEFSGVTQASNQPRNPAPVERESHQAAGDDQEPEIPQISADAQKRLFNAPDAPRTVMEALSQRMAKYKGTEEEAKAAGEGSKARRMGRIVKQYEDAIKSYRAGKPVDFDELPTPPGFAPIPVESKPPPQAQAAPSQPSASGATKPAPAPSPAATSAPARAAPQAPATGTASTSGAGAGARHPIQRQNTRQSSKQGQQLAFLKERLGEFKQAAINAKKKHDLELAKKYIRMMKGLEPMIEACECGLPVDLSQVPPSPLEAEDSDDKFVIVSAEDCQPTGDREEVFKNLQSDLVRQIRLCVANAQHYQKLGDVPAASRFQKLEQNCRRDLESLKSAYRHADPAPRFHYETRSFSMVQCNTELGDADMELTVVRGIQFNLPSGYSEKDMDTHVKYEFAFPTDEPQSGGTGTVKDTINPEYNETFRLQINRKSKGLMRYIERKGIKLEIFIKRGFFKGDKLLGTVNVKMQPLETKCTIHDSFDLMDGRKTVGGKLEVKLRIRDPFKSKQVEEVKEKWLVIDQFIRTVGSKSQEEAKAPKQVNEGTACMEVLRLEKQMLDKQIAQLKDSLSVTQTQALRHKSALIEEKLELQQKKLREGGIQAWKAVRKEAVAFEHEARQYARLGEVQKAELYMNKKKYAEKEIAAVAAKIPNA